MKKRVLGQFFTKKELWLKPQVKDFILNSHCLVAYDPFAGNGDMLQVARDIGITETVGLDIDAELGWKTNDSLIKIPKIEKAIIITNPPYLSNYSAKRHKILDDVQKYFGLTQYDDLYLLALKNMLDAQDYVVAIIPETFLNSSFPKNRLSSCTILEENPFEDTDTPVCVACFDAAQKSLDFVNIFKNGKFIGTLGEFNKKRLLPSKKHDLRFNVPDGKIALRAVDNTIEMIHFLRKENLRYDLSGIKVSSRLITIVDVDLDETKIDLFIETCNEILRKYREDTCDVVLSPFKGNMKNGIRRRRLDFETARAIMEQALDKIRGGKYAEKSRIVQLLSY